MSTKSKMTMDSFSVEIPNDFITIKIILSNGQNLIDYQKQTGKQLLLIGMEHKRRDQTNNFIFDYYKMEACSQTGLEGYFCVNFNKQLGVQSNFSKTSVKLNYNNTQDQQDKLTLIWSQCDKRYNEVGEICEDDANVVKNQIISLNTQITVRIKLNQFNPFTKQIESKWKSETYLIDSVLSLISQIKLKLDNATVIDGLVIQQTQKMSYVSDYSRCLESYKILYDINFKDKFKRIFEVGIIRRLQLFFISSSQQDLLKSKNITQEQSILLRMIDQSQQYTNIFYIQRQILEVQNMLKLLFSEQQYAAVKLCGIKLSLNYSQTTNNQIDNNQISQNQIKNSIINKKNMENLINQNRIDCELVKQNFITENQNDKDKAQNYLATENLSQNFQQIVKEDINIELQNKDQQLIKSLGNIENNQIISENKDNKKTQLSINSQKYQENSSSSLQNMQKQDNKVAKPAAISQVQFNELNKEYLRNNEQNQNQIDFNMIEIESQESIKMNHLEKLELIDQDYSYFQQQVKNFINQYKLDNQNTSEIDKRIYNSILGVPELQII
ncbi:hypothetical protein ABPG73_014169 [Tetrahymena malaccensis]